jgi:hypothetical protein
LCGERHATVKGKRQCALSFAVARNTSRIAGSAAAKLPGHRFRRTAEAGNLRSTTRRPSFGATNRSKDSNQASRFSVGCSEDCAGAAAGTARSSSSCGYVGCQTPVAGATGFELRSSPGLRQGTQSVPCRIEWQFPLGLPVDKLDERERGSVARPRSSPQHTHAADLAVPTARSVRQAGETAKQAQRTGSGRRGPR